MAVQVGDFVEHSFIPEVPMNASSRETFLIAIRRCRRGPPYRIEDHDRIDNGEIEYTATFYFIVHGGPDLGDNDVETVDLNTSDPHREVVAEFNQGGHHIHYPSI